MCPIKIYLPSGIGYALWGNNHAKHDVLLLLNHQIIIFEKLSALFEFVRTPYYRKEIEIFLGSARLKEFVFSKEFYRFHFNRLNCDEFDFVNLEQMLCHGRRAITNLSECSQLLDTLNIMYDVGFTLQNGVILSKMRRGKSELADLMDTLTFIRTLSELKPFNFSKICSIYKKLLKEFESEVIWFQPGKAR